MLNEDYSSDTSDEDFVPKGFESGSEEPTTDDNDKDNVSCGEEPKESKNRKKILKKCRKGKKSVTKASSGEDSDSHKIQGFGEKSEANEIEEKEKTESLWADFLADVDEKPSECKSKSKTSWASILAKKKTSTDNLTDSSSKGIAAQTSINTIIPKKPATVKVTKVFEFAGEEVRVEEEVAADSLEAIKASCENNLDQSKEGSKIAVKRPLGLSSIVGMLDQKKKKLSTLEKTKMDWVNFKSSEGIEDELKTHLKSNKGYLDKQEFLERSDLRQFEIEKNLRLSRNSKR